MPETRAHKEAKQRAAGNSGRTEVPLQGGQRLDARTPKTATEIERSGNLAQLKAAAGRLDASHAPRKVLQVPEKDMAKAREAMRSVGTGGTVRNFGGTKKSSVRRSR